MKKDLHPEYHQSATVTCSCGNTFTTGSTLPSIHVEICSACHPFYTGQEKLIDTEGRVERFEKRQKLAQKEIEKRASLKTQKIQAERERRETPKTLREMIEKEKMRLKTEGTSSLAQMAARAVKSAKKNEEK